VTDVERKEAERLAWFKYPADDSHVSEQLERECYVEGYVDACEAKQAEIENLERLLNEALDRIGIQALPDAVIEEKRNLAKDAVTLIQAERARSQKLIVALQFFAEMSMSYKGQIVEDPRKQRAVEAIAEYEASRD
jgi:hypothetical protein